MYLSNIHGYPNHFNSNHRLVAPALRDSLSCSRGQSCYPVAAGQVNGMVGTHHGINTQYSRHRSCITHHPPTACANVCRHKLCTFSWPVWPFDGASQQRPYPWPFLPCPHPHSTQSTTETGAVPGHRQYGPSSDTVRPANQKVREPIALNTKTKTQHASLYHLMH